MASHVSGSVRERRSHEPSGRHLRSEVHEGPASVDPEQLEDCREMCRDNGWESLGEFADENFTAYTGNRGPGLAAAIDLAKRTAAERGCQVFLVAQHTSRFARGDGASPDAPRALVELWHEWARTNVRGRLVENDSAMASSAQAAAQGEADHNESKRKSKSIRKGLRRRAQDRGKIAGGHRPYAYRWEDGALEVVPSEVPVVLRIYDEYLAGRSQMAIARDLTRDGIKAATGGKWTQVSVRHVLMKPLYCGKITHRGEVYPGAHEAVVTEAMWEGARALRVPSRESRNAKGNFRGSAKGSNNGGGRNPVGRHLLTKGLLRCGTCGDSMSPITKPRASGDPCESSPLQRSQSGQGVLLAATSPAGSDRYRDHERVGQALPGPQGHPGSTGSEAGSGRRVGGGNRNRKPKRTLSGRLSVWEESGERSRMATSSPRTMPSTGRALLAEREAAEAAVTQAHERAAVVG